MLTGIELIDDPLAVPPGYDPETVWEGLGLVDFTIVPHCRSAHPESAAAEAAARHLAARRLPFRALRDGEVVVWTGSRPAAAADQRRTA
jgi:dipeptidase E